MFTYNAQRAIAIRDGEERIALAGWLFNKLDRPINAIAARDPAPHEYQVLSAIDQIVRVFRLGSAVSVEPPRRDPQPHSANDELAYGATMPHEQSHRGARNDWSNRTGRSTHQRTGTLNCRPAFS
jgi:hypothetical protein